MKGLIDSNEENNSIYRIEKALYAYDFKQDLEEKNKNKINHYHSNSSSFDDSLEVNCNLMIENLKDENEKRKSNKNFFNKSSHRFVASANIEKRDIFCNSSRLPFKSLKNIDIFNNIDSNTIFKEDKEKRKTLDIKKFIEKKFKTNKMIETQNKKQEDSFDAHENFNNDFINEELLFIDSAINKNRNNQIVKSKFKLDLKNLDKLKSDDEKYENQIILNEIDSNKVEKNQIILNTDFRMKNKDDPIGIRSDFIRKAVEKNLNNLKQISNQKGSITDRNNNNQRNINTSGPLIKNNSMDNEKVNEFKKIDILSNTDNNKSIVNFFKINFAPTTHKITKNHEDIIIKQTNTNTLIDLINKNTLKDHSQVNNFKYGFDSNSNFIEPKLNKNTHKVKNSIVSNDNNIFIETNNKETFFNLNRNINQNKKINLNVELPNANGRQLCSNRDKTSNDVFDKLLGIREIDNKDPTFNEKANPKNNYIVSPSTSKEKFFSPNQNITNTIKNFKDIVISNKTNNLSSNSKNFENKTVSIIKNEHKKINQEASTNSNLNKLNNNFNKTNEDSIQNKYSNNKKIHLALNSKDNNHNDIENHNHRSQSEMMEINQTKNYANFDSNNKKNINHIKNSLSNFQYPINSKFNNDKKIINHETIDNVNNFNVNEIKKKINKNIKMNTKINSKDIINNFHNLEFDKKHFRSLNFNNLLNEDAFNKNTNKFSKNGDDCKLIFNTENLNKNKQQDLLKQHDKDNIKFKKFQNIKNLNSGINSKDEKIIPQLDSKNNTNRTINNNNDNFLIKNEKGNLIYDRKK